jgi:hypothetical protein
VRFRDKDEVDTRSSSKDFFRGSRYWRGYPARYRTLLPSELLGLGCGFVIFVLLPSAGAFLWLVSDVGLLLKVIFGCALGSIGTWGLSRFTNLSIVSVRVLPYFQSEVAETNTFTAGHALARNWERLDRLAAELGYPLLSHFGFADDRDGDTLVWHSATEGVGIVNAIKREVASDPMRWFGRGPSGASDANANELLSDLDRMSKALARAAERSIPFALVVRLGNGASLMEMAQRKGSFF